MVKTDKNVEFWTTPVIYTNKYTSTIV